MADGPHLIMINDNDNDIDIDNDNDGPHRVAAHHAELVDVPVREVRLVHDGHLDDDDVNNDNDDVHDGHLDVPVVDGLGVIRPVLVTLLPALLYTPGNDDHVKIIVDIILHRS